MKKILLIFAIFNAGLIFALFGLYYLAVAYPFHPGDLLYGLQNAAENELIQLTADPLRRAEMRFDLVERRLANISMAENDVRLNQALAAYDDSLSGAIRGIQAAPYEQAQTLYDRIDPLLVRAEIVLAGLDTRVAPEALKKLDEKIQALKSAASNEEIQKTVAEKSYLPGEIISRVIPFFGKEVDHGDFPIDGAHAKADCLDCHSEGAYNDTPSTCIACHSFERDLALVTSRIYDQYLPLEDHKASHYSDACADCHNVEDWNSVQYDHTTVSQCNACHLGDIPQEEEATSLPTIFKNVAWKEQKAAGNAPVHYPGDCSDCHRDTDSWETTDFDHDATACRACHSDTIYLVSSVRAETCTRRQSCDTCHSAAGHAETYPGECTNCHQDVADWQNVTVDHSTYTNCNHCHTGDIPAGHSNAACTLCHSTDDWNWVADYHGAGANCQLCHQRPENHNQQPCSTCHSTKDWRANTKDHESGNCASCHTPPKEHYAATCTDCHSTSSWHNVLVNHTHFTNCAQCHGQPEGHYAGSCLKCHDITSWQPVRFDHTGYSECNACHTTPANHYAGSCATCHSTTNWTVEHDFLHTIANNCASCHSAPGGHWLGECTDCHSTINWGVDTGFIHAIFTDCVSCHATPSGHWPGECANCHETTSWTDVHFDHTSYTDCKSCHTRPTGHSRGQCSRCHTTDSWEVEPEPTATTTTPDLTETETVDQTTIEATPGETQTATETPTPSETPESLEVPALPVTPTPSETPTPSDIPTPVSPPVPPETPLPSETPIPTESPIPVETPTPLETPTPIEPTDETDAPIESSTPVTTDTPLPVDTPDPVDTPAPPEVEPSLETPEPVQDSEPALTPAPTEPAEPTEVNTPPTP